MSLILILIKHKVITIASAKLIVYLRNIKHNTQNVCYKAYFKIVYNVFLIQRAIFGRKRR